MDVKDQLPLAGKGVRRRFIATLCVLLLNFYDTTICYKRRWIGVELRSTRTRSRVALNSWLRI